MVTILFGFPMVWTIETELLASLDCLSLRIVLKLSIKLLYDDYL